MAAHWVSIGASFEADSMMSWTNKRSQKSIYSGSGSFQIRKMIEFLFNFFKC